LGHRISCKYSCSWQSHQTPEEHHNQKKTTTFQSL
jgi:hypothetical protein